jgi:hypothetical protein
MSEAEAGRWTFLILIPAMMAFGVWASLRLGETGLGRGLPPIYRDKSPFWFWLIVGVEAVFGLGAFFMLLGALFRLFVG